MFVPCEFTASRSVSVDLAQRSNIILLAFDGHNNEQIEAIVALGLDQVGKWRRRWQVQQNKLIAIECGQAVLRETRNEEDTLENLDNVIGQDPNARFRLVMDNLNTHASESFVRYVAESIGYSDDLGKKGAQGILQSVQSRAKFLTDPTHRICFIFTPRHCSWLNQIEM